MRYRHTGDEAYNSFMSLRNAILSVAWPSGTARGFPMTRGQNFKLVSDFQSIYI